MGVGSTLTSIGNETPSRQWDVFTAQTHRSMVLPAFPQASSDSNGTVTGRMHETQWHFLFRPLPAPEWQPPLTLGLARNAIRCSCVQACFGLRLRQCIPWATTLLLTPAEPQTAKLVQIPAHIVPWAYGSRRWAVHCVGAARHL